MFHQTVSARRECPTRDIRDLFATQFLGILLAVNSQWFLIFLKRPLDVEVGLADFRSDFHPTQVEINEFVDTRKDF